MNKLIKTLFAGFMAVNSVCAFAVFDNVGNITWRANRGDFKISYAMLSGQIVYAWAKGFVDADYSSSTEGLCGDPNTQSQGKRLFDVLPGATYSECEKYLSGKVIVSFSPIGTALRTNYYRAIVPKDVIQKGAIIKLQMGNVNTREPPKLLAVVKKNKDEWDESCNGNGEYNGVTCEGWSYQSLIPLWDTAYPDDHTSF